ncbi:hypothetical protein C0J52_14517 [Blattella germanica]|nr:hypothetical protein C0J52_14517 [Blattella germanica]
MGEEKRLRVFENKVLRKNFGPKTDEETGEWIRLHNRHVARLGNERGVRRILEGKPKRKRPVGRPRMKDVWRAYVRTAMNLRVR